ncbi:methyltransferase domain-containing protein [Halorientalis pallida]|uniref:class I SAM-dependent methyltransferase n=1 Tax=Halorientalis pallida TaxID=2479928 RepID=UPI003C6FD7DF
MTGSHTTTDDIEHIVKERGYEPRSERHQIVLESMSGFGHIDTILDIGSGLGEFLEAVDAEFDDITGYSIDMDDELLQVTEQNVDAHCAKADAQRLPFESESFDVVTAIGIVEHVENPTQFVEEVHRVSRKGAVFVTPNIGRPNRVVAAMLGKDVREFDGHKQGWDYHLFDKFLESNGWAVTHIEVRYVDFPLYNYFPKLGRFMSYRVLPKFFHNAGTELFAFCEKREDT